MSHLIRRAVTPQAASLHTPVPASCGVEVGSPILHQPTLAPEQVRAAISHQRTGTGVRGPSPRPRTPPERGPLGGSKGAEHPPPAPAGDPRSVAPKGRRNTLRVNHGKKSHKFN